MPVPQNGKPLMQLPGVEQVGTSDPFRQASVPTAAPLLTQLPPTQHCPAAQQVVPQTWACGQQAPLMLVCPLGHWLQTG